MQVCMGESMVNYTKILDKKISSLFLKQIFFENTRKQTQILHKFQFETIEPSLGFIVNQLQDFKKNGIIKVRNKYI